MTTETETKLSNPYDAMEDAACLDAWAGWEKYRIEAAEEQHRIEASLHKRMQARDAKEIAHTKVECAIKMDKDVNQKSLLPLLELDVLTKEVLGKGFRAAHTEYPKSYPVAAKFHLGKVNEWVRKYGDPVRKIVDAATTTYPSGLVLKVKKAKKDV